MLPAPDLPAMLVNPGIMLETRKVFDKFDRPGANPCFPRGGTALGRRRRREFADSAVASTAMIWSRPLMALCPEIGRALKLMRGAAGLPAGAHVGQRGRRALRPVRER